MSAPHSNPRICDCDERYADARDMERGTFHEHGCGVFHSGRRCKYEVYDDQGELKSRRRSVGRGVAPGE